MIPRPRTKGLSLRGLKVLRFIAFENGIGGSQTPLKGLEEATPRAVNLAPLTIPLTPSFQLQKTLSRFAGNYSLPAHNGIVIATPISVNLRPACANTANSPLTSTHRGIYGYSQSMQESGARPVPNRVIAENLLKERG